MTKQETFAAYAIVAFLAYVLGRGAMPKMAMAQPATMPQAPAQAAATDPLEWMSAWART